VRALSVNMLRVNALGSSTLTSGLTQVAKFAEDLSLEELEVETTGCLGACSPPCHGFVPARFESEVLRCGPARAASLSQWCRTFLLLSAC
jgi:hypothetical protein